MPSLLYYKYSHKIIWESETGTVTLYNKNYVEYVNDEVKSIDFDFILGILVVNYVEYLILVLKSELLDIHKGTDIYKINKIDMLPLDGGEGDDTVLYIKQFIHTHDFYAFKDDIVENEFLWNSHMKSNLERYIRRGSGIAGNEGVSDMYLNLDRDKKIMYTEKTYSGMNWVIKHSPETKKKDYLVYNLICGYFTSKKFRINNDFYIIKMLSTVSSNKVGTRFLCRGVDSHGNVSFFVKTCVVLKRNNKEIFNFEILRGSVPLYWMQKNRGLNGKLCFYNNKNEAEEAFMKHFEKLKKSYKKIHVVTLLGERKDEKKLNESYIDMLTRKNISFTDFDLNAQTHNFESLQFLLFYQLDKIEKDVVFRVNCVDCLDRTNLAQFLICKYNLEKVIKKYTINKLLQECWTDNGNALSNLYTGSDVMKSELSLKQKRSFFGLVDDFLISATRLINNRFTDKQKNKIINTLLGKSDDENL